MRVYYTFIFCCIINIFLKAQNPTIGLLLNTPDAFQGYTLVCPNNSANTYLIDNCGYVVNTWTLDYQPVGTSSAYLLPNGNLIRFSITSLQIRAWNDELLWSMDINDLGFRLHHDFEVLPNGNILLLVYHPVPNEDAIAAGVNPELLNEQNLTSEAIIEIVPTGNNTADIVWEWYAFDHIIQEHDSTKANFGNIIDHPELLDINHLNSPSSRDWLHFNSIDYHSELDQIILSARHTSELYIIDHSTTTEEAATASGGNSTKGGNILWRWGNPAMYGQGSAEDQQLFLQHDVRWIPASFPNAGSISVFNNQWTDTSSVVQIIKPILSETNNTYLTDDNQRFLPETALWTFDEAVLGQTLNSGKQSGAYLLENGNVLVCSSLTGLLFEVNPDQEVVWAYQNPKGGFPPTNQYQRPSGQLSLFNAEKYSLTYAAFENRVLEPMDIIETENPMSEDCVLFTTSTETASKALTFKIYPNPVREILRLDISEINAQHIQIFDLNGRLLKSMPARKEVSIMDLPKGVFVLKLSSTTYQVVRKFIKL